MHGGYAFGHSRHVSDGFARSGDVLKVLSRLGKPYEGAAAFLIKVVNDDVWQTNVTPLKGQQEFAAEALGDDLLWSHAGGEVNDLQTGRPLQLDEGGGAFGTGSGRGGVLANRGAGVVELDGVGGDVHVWMFLIIVFDGVLFRRMRRGLPAAGCAPAGACRPCLWPLAQV